MPNPPKPTDDSRAPIASGKLNPPGLRVNVVERPSLIARLDNTDSYALALLRSPPGFGKTTVLAQWWHTLDDDGSRRAWLNLDHNDRDPTAFGAHIVAALTHAGLDLGEFSVMTRVESRSLPQDIIITTICEGVEGDNARRTILVLDDYHLAGTRRVDQFVEQLLQNMPPNLHIALASRVRPGFPVSKVRAFGRLVEIGEAELRFNSDEIHELFGQNISEAERLDISQRTQGWPVALQLARIWLDKAADASALSSFSGSFRDMAGYLTEQIISALPESDREFLIATSVVEEINGDLADALTGFDAGWDRLQALQCMGVPLNAINPEQTAFRYHPIFAEYLRSQLQRRGERQVTRLHRKASEWFADHNEVLAAIRHAILAGDTAHAGDLADRVSWVRQILAGRAQNVAQLRELLPSSEIEARPRLCAAVAFLMMKEGDIEEGHRLYRHSEAIAGESGRPSAEAVSLGCRQDLNLVGALDAVYSDARPERGLVLATERLELNSVPTDFAYRGLVNNALAILYFRRGELISARAAGLNSYDEYCRAGMRYAASFMLIHLAMFSLTQGRLDEAKGYVDRLKDEVSRYLGKEEGLNLRAAVFEAELLYERNDLETANDLLFTALPEIENSEGWVELYASAYRTAAFVAYTERGIASAEEALERGFNLSKRFGLERLHLNLTIKQIWLLLRDGQTAQARRICDEVALEDVVVESADLPAGWREREEATVVLAWINLCEKNLAEAKRLLVLAVEQCAEREHGRRVIQIRILRALVAMECEDLPSAVHFLKLAINDGREGYFIRLFLDFGESMHDLLKALIDHMGVAKISDAAFDWIAEVVTAFQFGGQEGERDVRALILTDRECDVLDELKVGGSNKVIARRLDMTDNAVKFHLRNIYRKLGVNSRRMAVAVANKRGL